MRRYVLSLQEIGRTHLPLVGGKGAHLGELSRMEGVRVPPGFCVTTEAFRRVTAEADLEGLALPEDVAAEITRALDGTGTWAVRSSATAEDLPTASFAGQHDSYLDVPAAAVPEHVLRCMASLFTERAVAYRLRNGFDHRQVAMAVVVQRMVHPEAAGVLFTADPVTSNRKVATVEAVPGLGEALVSGHANPDVYRVRDGTVVDRTPAAEQPVLRDAQVLRLAALGRRVEAHFGSPQDLEWCLADGEFHLVQSRPITTLFPLPPAEDGEFHVYLSVGHQQMMTDAMKPLGLSVWQLTTPRPMCEVGGRLFVDVTRLLGDAGFMQMVGRSDPLIGDALQSLVDRGFVPPGAGEGPPPLPPAAPIETNPALVEALVERNEASVAALQREIRTKSGPALLEFVLEDLQELRRLLFEPQSHAAVMAGMEAAWWLNERMQEWLGEKNAADVLTRSVPDNVTSEMGLALLDVADAMRADPEAVEVLQSAEDDDFVDRLPARPRAALQAWLDRYGMRCVGEIDLTRPRWSERPGMLVPVLLGNLRNFEPGAGRRRFERGLQEARSWEQELLERLRALPDGESKAAETKARIDRLRTFIGYREYPKYGMIRRYFVYKEALLAEADRLVQAGVLRDREDIFYLRFQELQEVVRTRRVDEELLRRRKDEFRSYAALTPPRVLTSEGEVVAGSYRREDAPPGALLGLPVSAGTVEGRARILLDLGEAELEAGDILVTACTDPSWTPVFVAIRALVTEVGGQMTHGAVIAREYGLPAVVGVEGATRLIRDGQRIRVNGTDGYVELLP